MDRMREKGFTLMELMVVIVIVAILAAVAVPLYVNYVKDAQRTEAKAAIGAVITAQQTFYQVNGRYVPNETFTAQAAGQSLNCDLTDALTNWTSRSPRATRTASRSWRPAEARRPRTAAWCS